MKIGIDLRFIGNNLYSKFVLELISDLIKEKPQDFFTIYTNGKRFNFETDNMRTINASVKLGSFSEQTKLYKIFKDDDNSLMIFFDHQKPILYKKEYICFVPSLKDVYYQEFPNDISKYKYLYLLGQNLNHARKIVTFDENTKDELVERFNTSEENINILKPFFPMRKNYEHLKTLEIDIRGKFGINNDYLVYSGGDGIEKNTDKLIKVLKRLNDNDIKIDIVFLGDKISKNISLRNQIIENSCQSNTHFLGLISESEKAIIYRNARACIFPSLYEPFAFKLYEPLVFDSKILSSNLVNIRSILGDSAIYFSPISINSIYNEVKTFLENNQNNHNSKNKEILNGYKKQETLEKLIEIIK